MLDIVKDVYKRDVEGTSIALDGFIHLLRERMGGAVSRHETKRAILALYEPCARCCLWKRMDVLMVAEDNLALICPDCAYRKEENV